MERRRELRQVALQLLFQRDVNPEVSEETARTMLEEMVQHREAREFAWSLYTGTLATRDAIDARIQSVAANWRLSRMAATDRNVLRMGVYEMTTVGTPAAIVLDECIEIARAFGGDKSGEFVNGVLDKLVPSVTGATDSGTSPATIG